MRRAKQPGMRPALVALASLIVAFVVATGAGCPSYALIPDDQRKIVDDKHTGSLLFLRQSVYVGDFYDDNRYKLVHPRKFEELGFLESIEGDAIPPPPPDGVIPAGTRVRVEKVEWPVGDVVFRRPIYTPRYTTWVWLRVARDRGADVTLERDERHIMLLPAGIGDAETFDLWFDAALSAEDPNPWLLSLPDDQQLAISQKQAVAGMTYDALTSALGFPDAITRDVREGSTLEVAVYGATSVVLRDGVVERVSAPSR
jgi:hypothetical protein